MPLTARLRSAIKPFKFGMLRIVPDVLQSSMRREAFIYIVGSDRNPVKVGHAENLAARLAGLQIGNPEQLFLHHAFAVPRHLVKQAEAAVHLELSGRRRRGEWFNVEADDAFDVVVRESCRVMGWHDAAFRPWQIELRRVLHRLDLSERAIEGVAVYLSCRGAEEIDAEIAERAGQAAQQVFEAVVRCEATVASFAASQVELAEMYDRFVAALNVVAERYDRQINMPAPSWRKSA